MMIFDVIIWSWFVIVLNNKDDTLGIIFRIGPIEIWLEVSYTIGMIVLDQLS